jgi:hypothetical protein
LLETFKIEEAFADEEKAPDYNVAPTKISPGGAGQAATRRRRGR